MDYNSRYDGFYVCIFACFADEEKSYDYNNVQSSNVTSNGYWTDVDNYDISWYTGNENSGSYDLTDSADLAGPCLFDK